MLYSVIPCSSRICAGLRPKKLLLLFLLTDRNFLFAVLAILTETETEKSFLDNDLPRKFDYTRDEFHNNTMNLRGGSAVAHGGNIGSEFKKSGLLDWGMAF